MGWMGGQLLVVSCLVMSCLVLFCLVWSCLVQSCFVLSSLLSVVFSSLVLSCLSLPKHMADTFPAMETSILSFFLQYQCLFCQHHIFLAKYDMFFQQHCQFVVVFFISIPPRLCVILLQFEEYDPPSWQYHNFVLSQYYQILVLCFDKSESMTLHYSSIANLFRQYYDFFFHTRLSVINPR